jgi:hypothetical protein
MADAWKEKFLQKWMAYLERDTFRISIQTRLIDPLLNHVLKRVFPYIILICVMFSLLLLSTLITLGVILFQTRAPVTIAREFLPAETLSLK